MSTHSTAVRVEDASTASVGVIGVRRAGLAFMTQTGAMSSEAANQTTTQERLIDPDTASLQGRFTPRRVTYRRSVQYTLVM